MTCYRDMTFCCNPECSGRCGRQFTKEDYRRAEEWWCGNDFPVAFMDACGTLRFAPPVRDLSAAIKAKLAETRPEGA